MATSRSHPPAAPDATEAPPLSATSSASPDYLGPVTKLANIQAAADEQTRIQRQQLETEKLKAMAAVVGQTASVIAAATKTGSPVRLSPRQMESISMSGGSPVNNKNRQPPPQLPAPSQQQQKMSVAARSRAMADLPAPSTKILLDNIDISTKNNNNNNDNDNRGVNNNNNQQQAPPASGGVLRGAFSKDQVTKLLDEWGKEDDEDEYYDDNEEDYYYDVPREEQFHLPAKVSNKGQPQQQQRQQQQEQFKSPVETSHLQYTMSQSPDPYGGSGGQQDNANANNNDEFHYQHHRVSNYNTSRQAAAKTNTSNQNQTSRQSHDMYSIDPDEVHADGEPEEFISGGGIFGAAKHWLQHQRDRLHQLELERQVEDQRRKLVEEGRRFRMLDAEQRRRQTVEYNSNSRQSSPRRQQQQNQQQGDLMTSSSFGCIEGQLGNYSNTNSQLDDTNAEDEIPCNVPSQENVIVSGMVPTFCGLGGAYANNHDDSTDYSGVARVDSQGNILEMIPSGSMDLNDSMNSEEHSPIKVSSPKYTLSGEGMSVNVNIPDLQLDNRNDDYAAIQDGGVQNGQQRNRQEDEEGVEAEEEEDDDAFFISDIKIVPEPPQDEITSSAPILQKSQMKALISSGGLPPSLNFCKWKRIYSLTRDGDSFDQFLRLVEGYDRTVLVVKTTQNALFGGYADTRWEGRHRRHQAHDFYGSAQACLFRFPNYGKQHEGKGANKALIYKWSGANRYIQLCDVAKRTVAFGGGGDEGDFGLCVEDDFRRGTTGHCSTFENEPLCEEHVFDILDVEVWTFTLDF